MRLPATKRRRQAKQAARKSRRAPKLHFETLEDRRLLAVVIDPDDFAEGTILDTVNPLATFSTANAPGSVEAATVDFPSTGTKGFRIAGESDTDNLWGDLDSDEGLRVDFPGGAQSVSIDVISDDSSDGAELSAFDVFDNLLDSVETPDLGTGEIQRLTVTSGGAPIAYVLTDSGPSHSCCYNLDRLEFIPAGIFVEQVTSPRTEPVDTLDVEFDTSIDPGTFDFNDITLTRDGGPNLITPAVTVSPLGGDFYQIGNLGGLTIPDGQYVLQVTGDGIDDTGGTPLTDKLGFASWLTDSTFTDPTEFKSVAPRGSLIYEGELRRGLGSPTETQSLTLDLDENQTFTVIVEPLDGLQPTITVTDPLAAPLGTGTAAVPGETLLLQTLPATSAGTYTLTVGATAGTMGQFDLTVLLNSSVEEEPLLGTSNDSFGTAENIDGSRLSLATGAARSAVIGSVSVGTALSLDRNGRSLRTVDLTTGATVSSVSVTLAGENIENGVGLAEDPTTGTLYALLKLSGNSSRRLVTLDPTTGIATSIADTRNAFAALAFDAAGNLFGVTGDFGATRATLYSIDKATGVPSFVQTFHTGIVVGDGESLAFDPVSGLLQHVSGRGTGVVNSVDPAALPPLHRGLLPAGDVYRDARTATYDGTQILLADEDEDLFSVDPATGATTAIGTLDHEPNGLAFNAATLFSLDTSGTSLRTIDPADGSTLTTTAVTFGVGTVANGHGLAADPTTGTLYGLLSIDVRDSGRQLVTIDPGTGVATLVGNTGMLFSGLTFDSTGGLYGITGDGADAPSALFVIDKTSGAPQFVKTLASANGDGEALAFVNGGTNELFHVSGEFDYGVMEAISTGDLPAPRHAYLPLSSGNLIGGDTRALTYDAIGDQLFFSDDNEQFYSIDTTTGIAIQLGTLGDESRGMAFASGSLYSLDRDGDVIREVDPADGSTISTTTLSRSANNAHGLATDPTSGDLYGVISSPSNANRELVTIDPVTGATTLVGVLNERIAAIAFDDAGNLFGLSGDGGATASSLFAINKADASLQFIEALGTWEDAAALAFNSLDGNLYHASLDSDTSLQVIDPADLPAPQPYLTIDPAPGDTTLSVFTGPDGTLFHTDSDSDLSIIDPVTGARSVISTLDHDSKGAVFLTPPEVTGDVFSFHLQANQPVTIGTAGDAMLELFDPSQSSVATGTPGAANLSQVISDFVPTVTGTYYARLTGFGEYSLVMTHDAAFDTEPNDTIATAQDISATRTVLGHLNSRILLGADNGDRNLLAIEGTDGSSNVLATDVGDGGGFISLARNPVTGELFGAESDDDDGDLFRIDPLTFAETRIGNLGGAMHAMAWSPDGTTLFGVRRGEFGTIDPTTAAFTFIGDPAGIDFLGGIAFQPGTGTLFAIENRGRGLHTLDPATGSLTLVGDPGAGFNSLEFLPDGTLLAGRTSGDGRLFELDPVTAAATEIGTPVPSGSRNLTGLEFLPELVRDDFFTIDVAAGELISFQTSTPSGGPLKFVNTLDPKLELFDPTGTLVAMDSNGAADNRNAVLLHQAAVAGSYTVRVSAENSTSGEYVLSPPRDTGVRIIGDTLKVIGTDDNDVVIVRQVGNHFSIYVSFLPGRRMRLPADGVTRAEIRVGGGSDRVSISGDFDSIIDGGEGDDWLFGSNGDDTILGGAGNDVLRGRRGDDRLDGGEDNDVLQVLSGTNILRGGSGNDTLSGGFHGDVLLGESGNDTLNGRYGTNLLIGGTGTDDVNGGFRDDFLTGGTTAHDNNDMALLDILAEWQTPMPFYIRVANIQAGTGLTNGNTLNAGTTVLDDGELDDLFGNFGRDWSIAFGDNVLPPSGADLIE